MELIAEPVVEPYAEHVPECFTEPCAESYLEPHAEVYMKLYVGHISKSLIKIAQQRMTQSMVIFLRQHNHSGV